MSLEIPTQLNEWRSRILQTVLKVAVILGAISLVVLLFGVIHDPRQMNVALFFLTLYFIILAIAIFPRFNYASRGWGLILIAYILGIVGLVRGGLAGAGRDYLILIPVVATIFISIRAGMTTAIISIVVMLVFSFIAEAGMLNSTLIYKINPVDLTTWITENAYSVVIMGVATSLVILFDRFLLKLWNTERQESQELELAHARLTEYNLTLEEKVKQRTTELEQAYQMVEQGRQRLQQELILAGNIQAGFIAKELPVIPGWQHASSLIPARETSGDFYDIYNLGKGRYGILIADVVDKGVCAALYMTLCWALIQTYARKHPTRPDLVAQELNHRLVQDAHSSQFVTVFYGVLDVGKKEMSYINAGHHPPYLFRTGKDTSATNLEKGGLPLGVFEGQEWISNTIHYAGDDLLVLYTDGVTDAEDSNHEPFGNERLINVILENKGNSAKVVHEAIIRSVYDHTGECAHTDDITLMVLACRPT